MSYRRLRLCLLSVWMAPVCLTPGIYGQAQSPLNRTTLPALQAKADDPQPLEPNFVRRGPDVPLYMVVREFFNFALRCHKGPNWKGFLSQLAIPPGTPAAELLRRTMFKSFEIHAEGIDLRPFLNDPGQYEAVQLAFTRKKVLALREAFFKMCHQLEEEGVSPAPIYEFMEAKIRRSIVIASHPGPDLELFEVMAEFEKPR